MQLSLCAYKRNKKRIQLNKEFIEIELISLLSSKFAADCYFPLGYDVSGDFITSRRNDDKKDKLRSASLFTQLYKPLCLLVHRSVGW